jgi:hypothetical protein
VCMWGQKFVSVDGGKRYNDGTTPRDGGRDDRTPSPRVFRFRHRPVAARGRAQAAPRTRRRPAGTSTSPTLSGLTITPLRDPTPLPPSRACVVSPASPPHATRRVPGTGIQRLTLFGLTFGDRADEPDKRFVHYRSAIWARGGNTTTAGEERSNRKRGARARGAEGRRGA